MKTNTILRKVLVALVLVFTLVLVACAKADFTNLQSAITSASEKVEAEYTSASWDALEEALTGAQTVLANEKAKQEEVDAALAALQSAVEALVKRGDKTQLNALVAEVEALDSSLYTASTWAAVSNALTAAKAVAANADALQADIDAAKTALDTAKAALAQKTDEELSAVEWSVTEGYKMTDDVVRYRADLEQTAVIDELKKLATATVAGVAASADNIQVVNLPQRNAETGLYPVGKHTVTFKCLGNYNKVSEKNVEIEIIDGNSVDYYFLGANLEINNANWKGGAEGIRVAANNFYKIVEGEELPLGLANGKLQDLEDILAVQNTTATAVKFVNSDTTGFHYLLDASGKIKFFYDGANGAYYDAAGKTTGYVNTFKAQEVTLEQGDIYLVIGYSANGNWYTPFLEKEFHWADGRYYSRLVLFDFNNRQTAGAVVKVVCGETVITSAYENQAPFLKSDTTSLAFAAGTTITKEMLINGLVFLDDNGEWTTNYATVSAENITVDTSQVDNKVAGTYDVTYTVSDGTLTTTYVKRLTITDQPLPTVKVSNDKTFLPRKYSYNPATYVAADADMFILDRNYTGNISAFQYGYYIKIAKDGKILEIYDGQNGKLFYEGHDTHETCETGKAVQKILEGYDFSSLGLGEYILVFPHDNHVTQGADNPKPASFASGLRVGCASLSITLENFDELPDLSAKITVSNGSEFKPRTYAFNPETYDATKADITIYNNKFKGTAGFGYGLYIRINAEGKIVEVYDGANGKLFYEGHDTHETCETGKPAQNILKDYDFSKLADGEYIIVFPHNNHVAQGDDNPKPATFANGLRVNCTSFTLSLENMPELEVVEVPVLSYTGTYGPDAREGEVELNKDGLYVVELPFKLYSRVQFTYNGEAISYENTDIKGLAVNSKDATWTTVLYAEDGSTLICSMNSELNYRFTYDPVNKTLNVELALSDNQVLFDKVNEDAGGDAIAVWTTAGEKLKDATNGWKNNGWRYYVVIDADGRVAYAVCMPPNGYGTPAEYSYYTNPLYAKDYNSNPVIVDPAGSFEIIVPEGGFGITAHGTGIARLAELFSGGAISYTGDGSEGALNKTSCPFPQSLRVRYDENSKILETYEAYDPQLYPKSVNADAGADAMAVWTTAGEKLKDATNGWKNGGWRYYIVVDAEGKIAYAVCMPPNGYGGPAGQGYYCHPDYSDYTTNPVFVDPTGTYEIVIPEGGFAITAHGDSTIDYIVRVLSNGKVGYAGGSAAVAAVNKRAVFNENIRLSYDSENGVIVASYEYPTLDHSKFTATEDKETFEGTDFYSVNGKVVKRWTDGKGVTSIDVGKASNEGALVFTVTTSVTVTMAISSTKNGNISFFSMRGGSFDGDAIANEEGITAVEGGSAKKTTVTYKLEAGTYYFTAAAFDGIDISESVSTTIGEFTDNNKTIAGRDIRVYTISIE